MAYQIQCLRCGKTTWARNLVDLIDAYMDARGQMTCARCNGTETYVEQITTGSEREPNEVWRSGMASGWTGEFPVGRRTP